MFCSLSLLYFKSSNFKYTYLVSMLISSLTMLKSVIVLVDHHSEAVNRRSTGGIFFIIKFTKLFRPKATLLARGFDVKNELRRQLCMSPTKITIKLSNVLLSYFRTCVSLNSQTACLVHAINKTNLFKTLFK